MEARVRALVPQLFLVFVLEACSGAPDTSTSPATASAASTEAADSTAEPVGEPIVIRASLVIAATEGAEITATGKVLEGSTLAAVPFCIGGTIEERHADPDAMPARMLDSTITCTDGTVTVGLTPEVALTPEPPSDRPQVGTWTIVGGTGPYETLRGTGESEVTYDPDNEPGQQSPAQATLTGTVTR
jgi:hypothetical protein